jgi:hypothetical protein
MDEDKSGNLFAGVYTTGTSNSDARIYKSANNGISWTSVYYDSQARHVHDVAVDKSNNYVYVSVGDNFGPTLSAQLMAAHLGAKSSTVCLK